MLQEKRRKQQKACGPLDTFRGQIVGLHAIQVMGREIRRTKYIWRTLYACVCGRACVGLLHTIWWNQQTINLPDKLPHLHKSHVISPVLNSSRLFSETLHSCCFPCQMIRSDSVHTRLSLLGSTLAVFEVLYRSSAGRTPYSRTLVRPQSCLFPLASAKCHQRAAPEKKT